MTLDEALEMCLRREEEIRKQKQREREEGMAALSRLLDVIGVPR
jgi:hypothetical protein